MGRINMTNLIVGIGAGAVDEVLEWQDEKGGRTESFKTWTDWGRVALTALGYLGQIMNIMPEYATPLAQSEVTLLTKSVGKVVRKQATTGIPARAGARVMTPSIRTPVLSQHLSTSSPSSPAIGRSYQPEFEQAGAF